MSLINDALRRAKEAQPPLTPPAGGPPLKPVDPAVAKSAGTAKMMIYIIVACVIAGNILLFIAVSDRSAKKTTATANPPPVAQADPATAAPVVGRAAPPAPQPSPAVVVTPAPATPAVAEETNAIAAVDPAPEPPKPAPLKLQSIIINPSRPSAMISGKFLFIGDRIQGWRVTAIDPENVTLVGNGQTNVLSLP